MTTAGEGAHGGPEPVEPAHGPAEAPSQPVAGEAPSQPVAGEAPSQPVAPEASSQPSGPPPEGGKAAAVALYLARQVVNEPDKVKVEVVGTRQGALRLSLEVAPGDIGRVIGRRGHVAQSMRAVVRAAGASEGLDVNLDVLD